MREPGCRGENILHQAVAHYELESFLSGGNNSVR